MSKVSSKAKVMSQPKHNKSNTIPPITENMGEEPESKSRPYKKRQPSTSVPKQNVPKQNKNKVQKQRATKKTQPKSPNTNTTIDTNVSVAQTPSQQFAKQRIRNQRALSEVFSKGPIPSNDDANANNANKLGINVETSVYNYTIREAIRNGIVRKTTHMPFVVLYTSRLRSVWWNLTTNPTLYDSLCTGEITPQMLETMTHMELNMEKWKDELHAKTLRDQSRFANKETACTSVYTCRKCRSRKCTFCAVQIRSSDEPMTVFVTCLDCGKNFTA